MSLASYACCGQKMGKLRVYKEYIGKTIEGGSLSW